MVSTLWRSAEQGQVEQIRELLKDTTSEPVDLEIKDHRGITPLIIAVQNGHLEVVKDLLAAGADPLNPSATGPPTTHSSDPEILAVLESFRPQQNPQGQQPQQSQAGGQQPFQYQQQAPFSPPPQHFGEQGPPQFGGFPGQFGGPGPMYYDPNMYGMPYMGFVPPHMMQQPPPMNSANSQQQGPNGEAVEGGENKDASGGTIPPPEVSKNIPCRFFPNCRYGAQCAFAHPGANNATPFFSGPPPHMFAGPPGAFDPSFVGGPQFYGMAPFPQGGPMGPPPMQMMGEPFSPPFNGTSLPPPPPGQQPGAPYVPSALTPAFSPSFLNQPPPPSASQPTQTQQAGQAPASLPAPPQSAPFTSFAPASQQSQSFPPNRRQSFNSFNQAALPVTSTTTSTAETNAATPLQPSSTAGNSGPVKKIPGGPFKKSFSGANGNASFPKLKWPKDGPPPACTFFGKGICKNKDMCRFAHINEDGVDVRNPGVIDGSIPPAPMSGHSSAGFNGPKVSFKGRHSLPALGAYNHHANLNAEGHRNFNRDFNAPTGPRELSPAEEAFPVIHPKDLAAAAAAAVAGATSKPATIPESTGAEDASSSSTEDATSATPPTSMSSSIPNINSEAFVPAAQKAAVAQPPKVNNGLPQHQPRGAQSQPPSRGTSPAVGRQSLSQQQGRGPMAPRSASANNVAQRKKEEVAVVPKQRVPSADEFPALGGSIGNLKELVVPTVAVGGKTAAQVLSAPAPPPPAPVKKVEEPKKLEAKEKEIAPVAESVTSNDNVTHTSDVSDEDTVLISNKTSPHPTPLTTKISWAATAAAAVKA